MTKVFKNFIIRFGPRISFILLLIIMLLFNVNFDYAKNETSVRNTYYIGKEPGSNDTKMEWIEIYEDPNNENKKLLLTSKLIDIREFNKSGVTNYKDSSLRYYLNDTFYLNSFSISERKNIVLTDIDTVYTNDIERVTSKDKIFILSPDELKNYNAYDKAEMTEYVKSLQSDIDDHQNIWLREINNNGKVITRSIFSKDSDDAYNFHYIRAAMWYDFSNSNNIDNSTFLRSEIEFKNMLISDRTKSTGKYIYDNTRSIDFYNKESIRRYRKSIDFGVYYEKTDGDIKQVPIKWYIVDVNGKESTLISTSILDFINLEYKTDDKNNYSYQTSSIRKFLNNDFYNIAFSDEEKTVLLKNENDDYVDIPSYNNIFKYNLINRFIPNTRYASILQDLFNDQFMSEILEYASAGSKFFIKNTSLIDSVPYFLSLYECRRQNEKNKKDALINVHLKLYNNSSKLGNVNKGYQFLNTYSGILPMIKVNNKLYKYALLPLETRLLYQSFDFYENIIFGKYEQDGNIDNGKEDISWRVIDRNDGNFALISEKVLDYLELESVSDTYFDSELRSFSNYTFCNLAFSDEEKNMISLVNIGSDDVNKYNDKVTYLSDMNEFDELKLIENGIDENSLTDYAKQKYNNASNVKLATRHHYNGKLFFRPVIVIHSDKLEEIVSK